MAILGKDAVGAARKALGEAYAAGAKEGQRLAAAIDKAETFAREAASVDPDDVKAFERATARLAELRAAVDLVRTREANAKANAEAARAALAVAENDDKLARLAALDAEIEERERAAVETITEALRAFDAELRALAQRVAEANALAAKPRHARGVIMFAGNVVNAVHALAQRGHL